MPQARSAALPGLRGCLRCLCGGVREAGERLSVNGAVQRAVCFKNKTGINNMKALVYNGPRDVQVKNVPDAKIERPTDMEKGKVLGHENLGQVVEVRGAVDRIKVGDWVCLPFNVSCGFCKNCERGLTGARSEE